MIYELMGPRCAGKTIVMGEVTRLARDIAYFSLGTETRREIAEMTPFGADMERYIQQGSYPAGYLTRYIIDKVAVISHDRIIIDGIPRQQCEISDFVQIISNCGRMCKGIIEITAPKEVLLQRASQRLVCSVCDHHAMTQSGDICLKCGQRTMARRNEDEPSILDRSITKYDENRQIIIRGIRERYPSVQELYVNNTSDVQKASGTIFAFIKNIE